MNNTKITSSFLFLKAPLFLIGLSLFLITAHSSEPQFLKRHQDTPAPVRMRDNASASKLTARPKSDNPTGTKNQLLGREETTQNVQGVKLGDYPTLDAIYLNAKARQQEMKSKSASASPRDLADGAKDTLNSAPPTAEGPKPIASEPAAPGFLEKLFGTLRKSGPDPKKTPGPNPEIRRKSYQPSTSDDILK